MNTNSMQRAIMRRVYYSYAISIVAMPMFWQGMFLSVSAYLLAKWLFVASIIDNLLAVPVGGAPSYVANAFVGAATHGELMTVLVFVLATGVAVSCGYRLAKLAQVTLAQYRYSVHA